MKFSQYPKKTKVILIGLVIFTALVIYGCSLALNYIAPDDSSTIVVMQWRFPLIVFNTTVGVLGFYGLGIFGSHYSFSQDGIISKRSFKEIFIPWDDVDKIEASNDNEFFLTIKLKEDSREQYEGRLHRSFSFANSDEVKHEIKKYFNNINKQ